MFTQLFMQVNDKYKLNVIGYKIFRENKTIKIITFSPHIPIEFEDQS